MTDLLLLISILRLSFRLLLHVLNCASVFLYILDIPCKSERWMLHSFAAGWERAGVLNDHCIFIVFMAIGADIGAVDRAGTNEIGTMVDSVHHTIENGISQYHSCLSFNVSFDVNSCERLLPALLVEHFFIRLSPV